MNQNELVEQVKQFKTVEELEEFAKENDIKLSDEDISRFNQIHSSELADDELDSVNGGITRYCSSSDTPKYKIGDRVYIDEEQAKSKGWDASWGIYTVESISATKEDNGHGHMQWKYTICNITTGATVTKFEFEITTDVGTKSKKHLI